MVEGESPSELVLVGGGDATLTVGRGHGKAHPTASLFELARATSNAVGDSSVRLAYDDSLFTGPPVSSAWEPTYVSSGVIAPVTALMADQGLVGAQGLARYADPAAAAAADFAQLLEEEGVVVKGAPRPANASSSAAQIAVVTSPPVGLLVERMLRDSDNQLAEALGRLAAVERDLPGSFSGAVDAIGMAANAHDITVDTDDFYDASGLSRQDLVTATALAGVLSAAATEPDLRPITTGLPVAGFDGTLFDRYLTLPQSKAAGFVRAKTGTLTGVSAEAGLAITCDGELVQFAFLADRVPSTPTLPAMRWTRPPPPSQCAVSRPARPIRTAGSRSAPGSSAPGRRTARGGCRPGSAGRGPAAAARTSSACAPDPWCRAWRR